MVNPTISIQTVLPPYEKILLTPIQLPRSLSRGKHPSSVEVYLHAGTKVRPYRFHVLAADSQRARRNRRRIVGEGGSARREYVSPAVEGNPPLGKARHGALAAGNRRRRGVRAF